MGQGLIPGQGVVAGEWQGWLCHIGPGQEPRAAPLSSSPGLLPQHVHLSLVFLLKCAQPGNKTGIVSGAFAMDTECMKCFLVGWEPVCLQEQHFEEAK